MEVDSTNRYARDEAAVLWASAGGRMAVAVVSDHQTAGRGQRGNTWQSLPGCNLLLSIMVKPGNRLLVAEQFLLSQTVAVAMHRAMMEHGVDVGLKWPNDVYVGCRKLAGVLVELDYSGVCIEQAIIGIGVNVNQMCFPAMDRVPVSMKMLLGKDVAVDDVLVSVINSFEYYYGLLLDGKETAVTDEYRTLLLGMGELRDYVDSKGSFKAVMEGVEPSGALLLRRNDGTLSRYMFKEVEQSISGV